MSELPDWATEKQKEGMLKFRSIVTEYHVFHDIEFSKYTESERDEHHQFYATVKKPYDGLREHKFRIGFDYEATWDCYGDRVHDWQFIFAGGDACREMTNELYFMDLFFVADKKLVEAGKEIQTLKQQLGESQELAERYKRALQGAALLTTPKVFNNQ